MQMYFEVILELKFYCYKIIIHAEANIPRYDREIKREREISGQVCNPIFHFRCKVN